MGFYIIEKNLLLISFAWKWKREGGRGGQKNAILFWRIDSIMNFEPLIFYRCAAADDDRVAVVLGGYIDTLDNGPDYKVEVYSTRNVQGKTV